MSFPFYAGNSERWSRARVANAQGRLALAPSATTPSLLTYEATQGQTLASVLQILFPGQVIPPAAIIYVAQNYNVSNTQNLFQGEVVSVPSNLLQLVESSP